MRFLFSFGRFWWTFLVGDDWKVAVGLAFVLGLTSLATHEGLNLWWLLPIGSGLVLASSVWRVTRTEREMSAPKP